MKEEGKWLDWYTGEQLENLEEVGVSGRLKNTTRIFWIFEAFWRSVGQEIFNN